MRLFFNYHSINTAAFNEIITKLVAVLENINLIKINSFRFMHEHCMKHCGKILTVLCVTDLFKQLLQWAINLRDTH